MRTITCPRCNGAGERCAAVSERWHRCKTCSGAGTIAASCSTIAPRKIIEDHTPLAVSTLHDVDGKAVDL